MNLLYSNNNVDLQSLNPIEILLPENFSAIKFTAYNLIDIKDFDGCISFSRKLDELLSATHSKTENDKYLKDILEYWSLRLKLSALHNLTAAEKAGLFKNKCKEILWNDLDVKQYILSYLGFYNSQDIIAEESKIFLQALLDNQEMIGLTNEVEFSRRAYKPTIANWLKEYQNIINQTGNSTRKPGAFHVAKFMDSNPYIGLLTSEEREILKSLIDLYNWLTFLIFSRDGKNVITQRQINDLPYMSSQRFTNTSSELKKPPVDLGTRESPVKKINLDEILSQGSGMRMTQVNQVAKPAVPPVAPNRPITRPAEQKPEAVKKTPPEIPRAAREPLLQPSDAPGQPQDLGQIREEIEAKKRLAQKAIDQRLGELKNRKTLPKKQV